MSDHGAGVAYRLWCEDTRDWTPTEGRIKANNAIAELEHELVGLGETLAIAIGEKLNQEHRAIAAETALAQRDEDFKMLRMLGSNAKYDEWIRAHVEEKVTK